MKELKDRIAAVTGAASGIGRGLAINLAKEGCGLALADVDEDGLNQTVERFDKHMAWTRADRAARIIIKGIKKNKARILVGFDAHIYDVLQRLFPVMWQNLMARL